VSAPTLEKEALSIRENCDLRPQAIPPCDLPFTVLCQAATNLSCSKRLRGVSITEPLLRSPATSDISPLNDRGGRGSERQDDVLLAAGGKAAQLLQLS